MPQASDELREKMQEFFGDPVDEGPPTEFLKSAGYTLRPDWYWLPKSGVLNYDGMTEKEWLCMLFLHDEWDYGWMITEENPNA